eukprot:TRINITY_DN18942_c0_g1_i1.p2 TRINITY_DN18942_c0_g1~~TRINITY_DN18942_c0_g1_i1.p2  ORF type:complete len:158 (-),score=5.89 TRINITY_DN18942_c0_g1_i1:168-641(-)
MNGLLKGLEQCSDTILPDVYVCKNLEAMCRFACKQQSSKELWGIQHVIQSCWIQDLQIDSQIPEYKYIPISQNYGLKLFGHIQHGVANKLGSLRSDERILIAIGPEGGWAQQEVDLLVNKFSFEAISLGDRVLSTHTATLVLCGLVSQFIRGNWLGQ